VSQETQTSQLVTVTDGTFADRVLASDRLAVVDFWAEWCPPCKMISKSLAELAEELGEHMVVVTLNADDNPVTTRAYGVMSLPTLLMFRRGEVVGSIVGARPKTYLRQAFMEHLTSAS
jgi:thioredoxin 1